MKFLIECVIPAGKSNTINFPNLSKQCFVPAKITITEKTSDGTESPVTGILCRVHGGGAEIGNYGEPSFKLSNELNLSQYSGVIDKTGLVTLSLTNRGDGPKRISVYCEYTASYGCVLVEEKVDHMENVLSDIRSKGFCTKLVMTFSHQLSSLEFANVAQCLEGEDKWVQPLNVPIEEELELENQVYVIDFTNPELGAVYSENLNFMELRATPKITKEEDRKASLYMYVIAYGFPHGR